MLAIDSVAGHRLARLRSLNAIALAIVTAVIIGLLAMHALSAPGASHHADTGSVTLAAGVSPDTTGHHDENTASARTVPQSSAVGCDCDATAPMPMPAPVHSMLLMACALALLAFVLLIAPPERRLRLAPTAGATFRDRAGGARSACARAPSLFVLSISRT